MPENDTQNQPLDEEQLQRILAQAMGNIRSADTDPGFVAKQQRPLDETMPASFGPSGHYAMDEPGTPQEAAARLQGMPSSSFGERLGAKPSVAPPSVLDISPGSGSLPDVSAGTNLKAVPVAPVGSRNPKLVDLLAQRERVGQPIDRGALDDAGKPKYKMGWGQRLLGSFANAASGFARDNSPTINVGPGALNNRYYAEERDQQTNLANLDKGIAGQEKLDTSNLNLEKEAQRQVYESRLGESGAMTAQARKEGADIKQQLADQKKGEPPANEFRGWWDSFLRDNKRAPTANEVMDHDIQLKKAGREGRQPSELEVWKDAFKRDNGRDPTADEIAQRRAIKRGTPQQFATVEQKKQQALTAAEKDYKKAIGQALSDQDKQEALDDLNTAKDRAQQAYETELQSLSGPSAAIPAPSNPAPARAATTAPAATPAANKAKVPEKPATAAAPGKVWVYEKKTGRRGQIPQAQLKTATQGANAEYATW